MTGGMVPPHLRGWDRPQAIPPASWAAGAREVPTRRPCLTHKGSRRRPIAPPTSVTKAINDALKVAQRFYRDRPDRIDAESWLLV
jgi:hypothetical protein